MSDPEVQVQRRVTAHENLRNIKTKIALLPENDQAMIAGLASQMLDLIDTAGAFGPLLLMYVSGNFACVFAEAEQAIDDGEAKGLPDAEEFVVRARSGLIDGVTVEGDIITLDGAALLAEEAQPAEANDNVFYVDGHGTTRRTLN